MQKKIDHIGIAVNSIDTALKFYQDLLHIQKSGEEILEDRGIKVVFLYVKDVRIELMEPIRENSEISKFLEKRGEGFHHIAFEVDDIEEVLKTAKKNGYRTLSDTPQKGAEESLVFFLHPKSANGILTEFVQHIK
ncbi:lactoylglutathione lyase [Petrotoga sp. 9PW.55.5.1]|uniref:methylmalonyl-CoA epimerase n=1 Tax=Petrotoga sp. 9PW.55.5.1 TaxID=1308979 RepID=UPI000DC35C85|nr:methylmalonyl-CoA epimerase [Petrotoga sp. 9PW.55.5.1]RAO99501.1 lactoylglutathione lyase [Petrotoga sp. 9PW.55.5.1]